MKPERQPRSFRAVASIGAVALVAGVLCVTFVVVAVVLERAARRGLQDDLARGAAVLADLQRYRASLFSAQARIVGDEPRLKAVVDTRDVTRETILGVAYDLKKAVASDLFLLTDSKGALVVDLADPAASGFDLSAQPVVRAALDKGAGEGVWSHEREVFQVHAQRLSFGGATVGVVVLGYAIDDRVADTVFRQTGDSTIVLYDGHVTGRSTLEDGERADPVALEAQLGPLPDGGTAEIELGGRAYLARVGAFPGYLGAKPMRYALLRSLARAREPAKRLLSGLGAVGVTAVAVALVLALYLSRRLARPLDELVAFTARLSGGRLEERVQIGGTRELALLGRSMNEMAGELMSSRAQLAEKERLARDLELAATIQTSILPREARVPGLEIGARMVPAEAVGGDYYDVFPVPGGAWIGIGDVAGHGLQAGLVMLMVQSAVAALVREKPNANPSELVVVLNQVLHDNIQCRLKQDEHVTFTLLRYLDEGRLIFAGAHEELVVYRRATGECERVTTLGTWIGVVEDIRAATHDAAITFEAGDLLLLYSDGLIQGMDAAGEQLGLERVCEWLSELRDRPAQAIADTLLERSRAHAAMLDDDVSVLVVRRT
jgi:phosphoserine phosphatase RsbU/P